MVASHACFELASPTHIANRFAQPPVEAPFQPSVQASSHDSPNTLESGGVYTHGPALVQVLLAPLSTTAEHTPKLIAEHVSTSAGTADMSSTVTSVASNDDAVIPTASAVSNACICLEETAPVVRTSWDSRSRSECKPRLP